jgi:hypothetical protein
MHWQDCKFPTNAFIHIDKPTVIILMRKSLTPVILLSQMRNDKTIMALEEERGQIITAYINDLPVHMTQRTVEKHIQSHS